MGNTVITIARQYGSGGKTIGKMLAKRLGIDYYDREILRVASEQSGINESLFGEADERVKGGRLFHVASKIYNGELLPPDDDNFTSSDNLFNYQAKVIRELANEESFVIIGRCADFVLKDYDQVISVFVHGSKEFCLKESMARNSMTEKEMERYIIKRDKYRGDYYKYHTGREWYDARNYDLCLDSSKLGFDKCVDAIIAYMDVRQNNRVI